MLLTTVHAEAMASDISGLSLDQQIENYKWLANQINDIAGTNFSVPSYASYACNDGSDNDNDGDADFPADAGCDSPLDDDESDPLASCSDGFESGDLSDWTLSGPGADWQATSETVYAGSYAARAKRTGAGSDSYMEMAINNCGSTFSYYRRLKGLDVGDDFEASYYNNGSWTSVEHLGSGSANDASFVFKQFTIPTSATKVRFKCECGATTEYCAVDSVSID